MLTIITENLNLPVAGFLICSTLFVFAYLHTRRHGRSRLADHIEPQLMVETGYTAGQQHTDDRDAMQQRMAQLEADLKAAQRSLKQLRQQNDYVSEQWSQKTLDWNQQRQHLLLENQQLRTQYDELKVAKEAAEQSLFEAKQRWQAKFEQLAAENAKLQLQIETGSHVQAEQQSDLTPIANLQRRLQQTTARPKRESLLVRADQINSDGKAPLV